MKTIPPHPPQPLAQWYQKESGKTLARMEHALLNDALAQLPGNEQVQIGALDNQPLQTHSSQIHRRVISLATDANAIPLPSAQADVVMLLHILEFSSCPLLLLREADRILRPGGNLLILGFNPFSLFGLSRFFHLSNQEAPWNSSFYSRGRIKEWSALLNLEAHSDPMDFQDFIFSFCPLCTDSVYLLQLHKRLSPLTPSGTTQPHPATALTPKAASLTRTITHGSTTNC